VARRHVVPPSVLISMRRMGPLPDQDRPRRTCAPVPVSVAAHGSSKASGGSAVFDVYEHSQTA
jgi:hypothetical protein